MLTGDIDKQLQDLNHDQCKRNQTILLYITPDQQRTQFDYSSNGKMHNLNFQTVQFDDHRPKNVPENQFASI